MNQEKFKEFTIGFLIGTFIVFTIYIVFISLPTTYKVDTNNIVIHKEPILNFYEYKNMMGCVNPTIFTDRITNNKNPKLFRVDLK